MSSNHEQKCEVCPMEQTIDDLYEIVIRGNGRSSLTVRMDAQERQMEMISRIVQGDGEKTGLQPQMIAINASLRLTNWLIVTLIALLAVLATVYGPKVAKIGESHPTQTTEIYALR